MLFRQAGVFHTNYAADRALFPIAADRWMIGALLVLGVVAPFLVNSLYLSSYLLPWLVWTAGALGLNLILGWAGQFHLGYAAVMGIASSKPMPPHSVPQNIRAIVTTRGFKWTRAPTSFGYSKFIAIKCSIAITTAIIT